MIDVVIRHSIHEACCIDRFSGFLSLGYVGVVCGDPTLHLCKKGLLIPQESFGVSLPFLPDGRIFKLVLLFLLQLSTVSARVFALLPDGIGVSFQRDWQPG